MRNHHVALLHLNVRYIKASHHPMLLHSLSQRETIHLTRSWLENIQAAIQNHLPARIRGDVASMNRASPIKRPCEINARTCAGLSDPVQAFPLLLDVPIVRSRDKMHSNLILGLLAPNQHLDQFHHVARLMELPDIGIGDDDPRCTIRPRTKDLVEADALAVFSENDMSRLRNRRRDTGNSRCLRSGWRCRLMRGIRRGRRSPPTVISIAGRSAMVELGKLFFLQRGDSALCAIQPEFDVEAAFA